VIALGGFSEEVWPADATRARLPLRRVGKVGAAVPKPFEPPPNYSIEVDGEVVGPTFAYGDEEDAHRWVARNHPERPYTIISVDGVERRVDYLPLTTRKDDDHAKRVRSPPAAGCRTPSS
jgi:hypothetical protein